jgi:hypothetical protein
MAMVFNALAYSVLETIGFGWPCTIMMLVCWYAWKGDFKSSYNFRPLARLDLPEDVATKIDKKAAKWLFYTGCLFWCGVIVAWAYGLLSGNYDALMYLLFACLSIWALVLLVLVAVFYTYAWSLSKKTGHVRPDEKSPAKASSNLLKSRSHMTIVDWLIEAAALAGLVVGLAIINYGGNTLPAVVPSHLGGYGSIDNYSSKWTMLGFYFIILCITYIALTIANRYVYRYYDPSKVSDESASRTNHILQAALRTIKLIYLWLTAGLAAYYINVMPDDPPKALGTVIITIVIFVPLILVFLIVTGLSRAARGTL